LSASEELVDESLEMGGVENEIKVLDDLGREEAVEL